MPNVPGTGIELMLQQVQHQILNWLGHPGTPIYIYIYIYIHLFFLFLSCDSKDTDFSLICGCFIDKLVQVLRIISSLGKVSNILLEIVHTLHHSVNAVSTCAQTIALLGIGRSLWGIGAGFSEAWIFLWRLPCFALLNCYFWWACVVLVSTCWSLTGD